MCVDIITNGEGKEDKSPARGRKHVSQNLRPSGHWVRKISPLQGDGNADAVRYDLVSR